MSDSARSGRACSWASFGLIPFSEQMIELRRGFCRHVWHFRGLGQQSFDRASECSEQFGALEGSHQRAGKLVAHVGREVVEAPAVNGGQTAAAAGQMQSFVADAADPIFGLPKAAALDAESRAQRMM